MEDVSIYLVRRDLMTAIKELRKPENTGLRITTYFMNLNHYLLQFFRALEKTK